MKQALVFSVIVLIFCSCSNISKSDLSAFHYSYNSLEHSNQALKFSSDAICRQLSTKINHLSYRNDSFVWYAEANRFSKLCDSACEHIQQLKFQLIKQSGKNTDQLYASGNFRLAEHFFVTEKNSLKLYNVLKFLIDSAMNTRWDVDSMICRQLIRNSNLMDTSLNDSKKFTKTFFNGVSTAAALSTLSKFENDIRNIEHEFVTYCYNMTLPGCILQYERFQAIVGQSSNCVKAGDNIELFAGIGSFSVAAVPKFSIDGKAINCDIDGVMTYKFKTPLKAGNYSKSVKIEYTKPDGTRESKQYEITYSVIDPKQPQ